MVNRATGERNCVENHNARGAKRVSGNRIFLAAQDHAADDKADSDEETERNADFGRDEIVLERILHEIGHGEEQRESADPGEQFRPHELLPVQTALELFKAERGLTQRNRWYKRRDHGSGLGRHRGGWQNRSRRWDRRKPRPQGRWELRHPCLRALFADFRWGGCAWLLGRTCFRTGG